MKYMSTTVSRASRTYMRIITMVDRPITLSP